MAEPLSWIIPAASQAWENRETLVSKWDKVVAFLLGRKTRIALTGLSGTGKTVLFDCLTGAAFRPDYYPPKHASVETERAKISAPKKRIALSVIPGQAASTTRFEAIEQLFGDDPVEGVIHVVANGFVEIRNREAREILAKSGKLDTLQKFRAHQFEEEVRQTVELCQDIRRSQSREKRRPRWLIVAVTKADLFSTEMSEAQRRYSPDGDGEFVLALNTLKAHVGEDNFTWTALPVCGWPEDFTWQTETIQSRIGIRERQFYVGQLADKIKSLCLTS